MRDRQRAVIRRYHDEGMSRRDSAAVLALMSPNVGWFSVDHDFHRRWYRGHDEIRGFLDAMFTTTPELTFVVDLLLADPSCEDVVVAEWHNHATTTGGTVYENRGCTIFSFDAGTEVIAEVRQYFDWGPLMERADWRASVRELA